MGSRALEERLRACESNPLAAFLATRFPKLLLITSAILGLNLLAVGLLFLGNAAPALGRWMGSNHWALMLPTLLTIGCGLVLALELSWMMRHKITPELACDIVQNHPPAVFAGSQRLQAADRTLRLLHQQLSELAAVERDGSADERRSDSEVRRSYELLYSAMAECALAFRRGLADKASIGQREQRSGFRHLEETLDLLKRLKIILDSRCRELYAKRAARPCKTSSRRRKVRPGQRHREVEE